MIPRYTQPKRKKPFRPKRRKPAANRLRGEQMKRLREEVFARDLGICQACGRPTIFNAPHEWDNSFHLAHKRTKRIVGDSAEVTQTECGKCHRDFHNYGPSRKPPCPPTDRRTS